MIQNHSIHDDYKQSFLRFLEGLASLTPREREVLECIVEGHSTKQIAKLLGISPGTVRVHRERVLLKTGVSGAMQLIRLSTRAGL